MPPIPPNPPHEASCHCGAVRLALPSPPAPPLNECRCSVCWSYGAMWAYYPRSAVRVSVDGRLVDPSPSEAAPGDTPGLTEYVRQDLGRPSPAAFCSCARCGATTHWWVGSRGGGEDRMGVNTRGLSEASLEGVERKVNYQ